MNDLFICPVCKNSLHLKDKIYQCKNSHSFDISSEGYVNLAVGKSGSGDNKEMSVSRRSFLSKGHYARFADFLCETLKKYCHDEFTLIDAGCGEGYYLRKINEYFKNASLCGIDLSKSAIKLASKSEKNKKEHKIGYAVAGIFDMPFPDVCADAVLSVFAPVPNTEAARVLKKDGKLIVISAGQKHLDGLKKAIYRSVYDNDGKIPEYPEFEKLSTENLSYSVKLIGDEIKDLFTMTPYFWKTSKEDKEKLYALSEIETLLSFDISVYKKIFS